jgi:hypothetical protein
MTTMPASEPGGPVSATPGPFEDEVQLVLGR